MKHLRKIQKVRGSSVEALTWFEDMNATEQTCVRRNILPIMVTCEYIVTSPTPRQKFLIELKGGVN